MLEYKKNRFSQLANFTKRQKQAMRAVIGSKRQPNLPVYKFVLYGGAAGGGKSYWIRWALVKLLMKYWEDYGIKGVRVGLFCEDYPALKDRHLSKIAVEFPSWLGSMNKTESNYVLNAGYGGGTICFRNLDNPSKYASSEFASIGVDEITRNPYTVFSYLRMRCRWPGIPDSKFLCASNPDGIGHNWVKKIWLDGEHEPTEQEADKFHFIPATVYDNPHLPKEYIASLEGLPETLREAYLKGNWDIFEGQFFTEWDRSVHIVKPFEIPEHWQRYLCCDYGWSAPSAIYWVAVDGEGRRYHYRELYVTKKNGTQLAELVIKNTPKKELTTLKMMYCDPSMWTTKAGEETCAVIMQRVFNKAMFHVKLDPAETNRPARALNMREHLAPYLDIDGTKTAKFLVFDGACPHLVRTLPALPFSKSRPEDVDTAAEDHAYDAAAYGFTFNTSTRTSFKELLKMNDGMKKLESSGVFW